MLEQTEPPKKYLTYTILVYNDGSIDVEPEEKPILRCEAINREY